MAALICALATSNSGARAQETDTASRQSSVAERLEHALAERIERDVAGDSTLRERLGKLDGEQRSWLLEALKDDDSAHLRDVLAWVDPEGSSAPAENEDQTQSNAQTQSHAQAADGAVLKALPDNAAKSGVTSQQIVLPSGEGSIKGMGESFTPNLSSGTGTFSVPIALPAGRAGVQPSLGLSYSTAGGNGPLGIGWSIGAPAITRQTDKGLPRYVDGPTWTVQEDRFIYNGGQELVPVSNADAQRIDGAPVPAELAKFQQYRARVEGSFMRFFRAPDGSRWVVQSKDGTRFEFGAAVGGVDVGKAVQADPEDPRRIFAWHLVRMSDAHGASVQYQYRADGGNLYLADIYYDMPARCGVVGKASDTRNCTALLGSYGRRVHFVYDTREDASSSYATTWRTEQRLRLVRVEITSHNGSEGQRYLVRRYHFGYDTESYHSLLASVEVEGRPTRFDSALQVNVQGAPVAERSLGDAIVGTLLPPMTFSYTAPAATSGLVSGFGGIDATPHPIAHGPDRSLDGSTTDLFDVNGDGLADVISATGKSTVSVFFNGFRGKDVASPASFSSAVSVGLPSGLAASFKLSNANLQPMDVDGDGHGDFLHMPKRQEYGYFVLSKAPVNGRFAPLDGWSFAHVPVKLAQGQDPRIDLANNSPFIRTMDVNRDSLIDVVRTTGTSIQVWLNLGHYPGGDGRFGSVTFAPGPVLSTEPVTTCLPRAGTPVDFSDSRTRLADLNGDGLTDIVQLSPQSVVYWPGRGEGAFGTGARSCTNSNLGARHLRMENPPTQLNPNLEGVQLVDVNGDGADDLVQVNAQNLSVWFNRLGQGFSERLSTSHGGFAAPALNRVRATDIDGSGTVDLLFGTANDYRFIDPMGGRRPRLLESVDNGLGALMTLTYGSSAEDYLRDLAASQSCDPARHDCFTWHREASTASATSCDARIKQRSGVCVHRPGTAPVISTVIRRLGSTDRLDVLGVPATVQETEYLYHDGYYEGIEQEFRGFGAADAIVKGDAYDPTSYARTYFHQGRRPNEIASDRLAENPNEALKGREFLSESWSVTGTYLVSRHATYRVRKLLTGLDGRFVSYAFVSANDELRYDTAPFTAANATLSLASVEREQAGIGLNGSPIAQGSDAAHTIAIRGARHAQLRTTYDLVDNVGNLLQSTAHGRVGQGEAIVSYSEPARIDDSACTGSSWLWRTGRSYVRDGGAGTNLSESVQSFNACGDLVRSTSPANLPADASAGFEFAGGAAPAGLSYTQTNQVLESSTTFNAWGEPLRICTGADLATQGRHLCLRYSEIGYDVAYQAFPESELTATSMNANTLTGLTTRATWDPGIGALTSVIDPANQLSRVMYDGLGRPTASLLPPVRSSVTCAEGVPVKRIVYELTSSARSRPISRVHTFSELDCRGVGYDTLESYSYVDGRGRVRATLSEGDPKAASWADNRGHAYIRAGLAQLTSKGKAWRSYQASFYDGSPDALPNVLASPAVPFNDTRYDAFGRATRRIEADRTSYTRTLYHALSTDSYDQVDVDDRCAAGDDGCASGGQNSPVLVDDGHPSWFDHTFSSLETDGHGRPIARHLRQAHYDGGLEHHYLFSYFRADGVLTRVVRALAPDNTARPAAGSLSGLTRSVVRAFFYDSAGRRIASNDPDTNRAGATQATGMWRYLFNRAGDLAAVRDPRGSGQNFFYDRAGRLLGEQYITGIDSEQPQELRREIVPNDSVSLDIVPSNTSVQVRYFFDDPVEWVTWAKVPASTDNGKGRLSAVSDRGQRTAFAYDARGNTVWTGRQLALISTPSVVQKRRDGAGVVVPQIGPFPDYQETPVAAAVLAFDEAHLYETSQYLDHAGRVQSSSLPVDHAFAAGTEPKVAGVMSYGASGAPAGANLTIDGDVYPLVSGLVYDRDGVVTSTVFGDGGRTRGFRSDVLYDDRRRSIEVHITRTATGAPGTLSALTTLVAQRFSWDPADNLLAIDDLRAASEWPAGHKPQSVSIRHDALYRVEGAEFTYPGAGSDAATDWRTVAEAHRASDPMHSRPAAMAPQPSGSTKRVADISYEHDWLANMVSFEDDANLFYERSIGTIVNGQSATVSTASGEDRPSALYLADNVESGAPDGHRGWLETTFGVSGNLATMTVHARCANKTAQLQCRSTGNTLSARRNNLRANCTCAVEQHYTYRYDELNRMSEARRFDREAGSWELKVRQRYRYGSSNQRTLKQTIDITSNDARVALYAVPDAFERRGLRRGTASYDVVAGESESQYLVAGARLVWANKNTLAPGIEPDHRITVAVPDLIQSTSAVIDLISGEPLEVTGFYPNGAREHYLTSGDPEALDVPLEPYGFTGKEAEEEVGLTYFGERYLVQRLGRWATPDPLSIHALGGGEIANSYHYVSGNLLQARDPLGLAVHTNRALNSEQSKLWDGDSHYVVQDGGDEAPRNGTLRHTDEENGRKLYTCKGRCDFDPPGGAVREDPAVRAERERETLGNVSGGVISSVTYAAVSKVTGDRDLAADAAALGALGDGLLQGAGIQKQVIEPVPNEVVTPPQVGSGRRSNTVRGSQQTPPPTPTPPSVEKVKQKVATMTGGQKRRTGAVAAPDGEGPTRASGGGENYDVPLHPEMARRMAEIPGGSHYEDRGPMNCAAARCANDYLHQQGPNATSLEGLSMTEMIPKNLRPMTPCDNCRTTIRGATLNGRTVTPFKED